MDSLKIIMWTLWPRNTSNIFNYVAHYLNAHNTKLTRKLWENRTNVCILWVNMLEYLYNFSNKKGSKS